MEWYYAIASERRGPITEPEFLRLVNSGEIGPETLVWREGMAAWQPAREVQPAAPSRAAVCSQCGSLVPENELLVIDGRRVCAACKPTFLQRVREGVPAMDPAAAVGEKLLALPELLQLSWAVWTRNFGAILLITLLTSVPINMILDATAPTGEPSAAEFGRFFRVIMLLDLLLGSIATIGIAYLVNESIGDRTGTLSAALRHAFSRWLSAVGTGLLENIIVILLTLLLIVPGIIWLGYYTFAIYVVALRGIGGKPALDYSKELVRGRWWRVVGFVLALFALSLFPAIALESISGAEKGALSVVVSTLGNVVVSFTTVAVCVLFLNLDALKQSNRL